jgi:hypothetical protein
MQCTRHVIRLPLDFQLLKGTLTKYQSTLISYLHQIIKKNINFNAKIILVIASVKE